MANKDSVSIKKMVSIALIVIGIGLVIWGYQLSESIGSQLTKTVTGSYTDKAMTLFIGGAASFFVGLFLFLKK